MYCCEECQREFKTAQALAGHDQFKHGVRRAAGAALQQLGQQLVEHAPAAHDQHAEQLNQQLGYIVERLDELLAPAAEHAHDSACSGCQQMAQETYGQGRVAGIKEIAEIPGVSEAVLFAKESEQWNAEHPDRPPTIENWALVEQVQELVDGSRPQLIRIVESEDPLIKIIKAEEPTLDDDQWRRLLPQMIRDSYDREIQ